MHRNDLEEKNTEKKRDQAFNSTYRVVSYFVNIFSSVREAGAAIRNYSYKDAIKYFLLGDDFTNGDINNNIESLLRDRAMADTKNSIGIAHIGPPKLGINIAQISQFHQDQKYTQKQIDAVLNLSEESSRVPYEILNLISGASFLLADSSANAILSHKKLSSYLKPKAILEEFKRNIPTYFPSDFSLLDRSKMASLKANMQAIVVRCFTKTLFGVEATPKLNTVIDSLLEQLSLQNIILPLLVQRYLPKNLSFLKERYLPMIIERYFPNMASTRREVDAACHEFFQEKAGELQQLIIAGESNLLIDTIKKIVPANNDLTMLSKTDWSAIADNVETRNAIFSLFAIDNAALTISSTATETFLLLNDGRLKALRDVLDQQNELHYIHLSEPHSTTLQAVYNYGLLQHSKFSKLFRYTKEGVHTPEVEIPANSFIFCDISGQREFMSSLDDMYCDRLIFTLHHGGHQLPSVAYIENLLKTAHFKKDVEVPVLIKLAGPDYFFYGRINENEWAITNIGAVPVLDKRVLHQHMGDSYSVYNNIPYELQQAIAAKKAHLPFCQQEQLKHKLGEGRLTLFGRGARRCPAAADVSTLTKYLIVAIVKNYERINDQIIKRHPEPANEIQSRPGNTKR